MILILLFEVKGNDVKFLFPTCPLAHMINPPFVLLTRVNSTTNGAVKSNVVVLLSNSAVKYCVEDDDDVTVVPFEFETAETELL